MYVVVDFGDISLGGTEYNDYGDIELDELQTRKTSGFVKFSSLVSNLGPIIVGRLSKGLQIELPVTDISDPDPEKNFSKRRLVKMGS